MMRWNAFDKDASVVLVVEEVLSTTGGAALTFFL